MGTGVSAHLTSILRNQIATTNGINGRDMLATGAVAFGICSLAGVVQSETVDLALFVLTGTGVDDAVVIVRSLEASSRRRTCGEAEAGAPPGGCHGEKLACCIDASGGMMDGVLFQTTLFVALLGTQWTSPFEGPLLRAPCLLVTLAV